MNHLKHHAREMFRHASAETPWSQMTICALATSLPLALGLLRGEVGAAIFGALLGYFVTLNDHLGPALHRSMVAVLSAASLFGAFAIGLLLQQNVILFLGVLVLLTYWLGLMGGRGAEIERLIAFALIELLVGFYNSRLTLSILPGVLLYSSLALLIIVVSSILHSFWRSAPAAHKTLRESLAHSWTFSFRRHCYATSLSVTLMLALCCVEYWTIQRGYWTVITVLLIMRPSRQESVYRSIQRLLGTLAGILLGAVLLAFVQNAWVPVVTIGLAAFGVPFAQRRNYALVSFLVSMVVLCLVSLPNIPNLDPRLPAIRLEATLYGCALSLFGVGLFRCLEQGFGRYSGGPPA